MKQTFGKSHVPLSPAVRAGDLVYVSGQVPTGKDGKVVPGGIEEQTKQVLENVKAALALAGCGMADVVKASSSSTTRASSAPSTRSMRAISPKTRRRARPSRRSS